MQVTSMLSAGYLQPSVQSDSQPRRAVQIEPRGTEGMDEEVSLSRQEREVLAQEQNLKAKLGTDAEVHTVYHYTMGEDGRRYITGASVTMRGDEEDLSRVGGTPRREAEAEDPDSDPTGKALTDEEEAQVRELEQTQREVIAHEMAHQAAAGALGGGVSYSYTQGPDGKSYITGGEVPIQLKMGATPEETLRNMEQVQRAATAPADPSGQDRQVAARAAAIAAQARAQMRVDPSKTGVASVLGSIREEEVQSQLMAA